ncbi:MAG TPA: diguanylate cyclase [Candidatus Limnocylindrales bacterium]|jgi:diguanylate cyclase (GGDEF)-like protein|nr:diguanylate cyclase [Candidatus Limnocylindrales bacterium]
MDALRPSSSHRLALHLRGLDARPLNPTGIADGRRSPRLLLLVFAASLFLVVLTAGALAVVTGDNVTAATLDSAVNADRSLVQDVVQTDLSPSDLTFAGPSPARVTQVQQALAALVGDNSGLLRIKVHAPDGTILFSDDPSLRGQHFPVDDALADALEGNTGKELTSTEPGEEAQDLRSTGASQVLEEYLPIVVDGQVPAVFEVYRDAAPLMAMVTRAQVAVLAIMLTSALALAALLWLIFRAAQILLDRQTQALVEATHRDALTDLLNHGAIVARLTDLLGEARSGGGAVGLALVDIDNFRLLNEAHGHPAGDVALTEVAAILRQELSEASEVGRYGPDEFLAVAPPACVHDLAPAVERMRARLVDLSLQFGASERLPVTVSVGICEFPDDGEAATELLSQATVALVEAKAGGGDAVRHAERRDPEFRTSQRSSFDILQGLVIAVDTKDRYTKRHSEDVARYALFLAECLDLDDETRRTLRIAGLLHDVGKIGIPDSILRKPAALTDEEYGIVKQHVTLGDAIVRDLPNLGAVRSGIRGHHERWDGRGYVDGLAGEGIPLVARILAVGDAFSAMTTTRPYRKALSIEEALRRLQDAADSQLDPRLVTAFVQGIETAPHPPLPGLVDPSRPLPRLLSREVA